MRAILAILLALFGASRPCAADETWRPVEGARTGAGPTSTAEVLDGGVVRLEGTTATARWLMLERDVDIAPGARWLRVSATVRTDDVCPELARYKNCNVVTLFPGARPLGSPPLVGTRNWTRVARRWPVPPGATKATLGLFLSMPGRAWFKEVRAEVAPDFVEERAGAFVYRHLPGDPVPAEARAFNEESLGIVRAFFETTGTARIDYWKYPDLDAKEEVTGVRGNAHFDGDAIHSIWPRDRHEIVHLFAKKAWGEARSALLGEGLAVHISGSWQGKPVKAAAREVLESGKWIPLARLADARDFREKPDLLTYAIAGAYVERRLETAGKAALREAYPREVAESAKTDEDLREWLRR